MPWKQAIITVLQSTGVAMTCKEIAREIVSRPLRKSVGATPRDTVSAYITTSLNREGDQSPFQRVDTGLYILRDTSMTRGSSAAVSPKAETVAVDASDEGAAGIIRAVGMYWRRELVDWTTHAPLWGQYEEGADPVDFGPQKGVYLLHDGREVIYVGRASDQTLGKRLSDHTSDRLNTRWDRFSWFGLLRVTPEGKLEKQEYPDLNTDDLIKMMESILIEGLEPRQNRKRGDDLTDVEYLQVESPRLRTRRNAALLAEIQANMRAT
jgi:hypothetical protein